VSLVGMTLVGAQPVAAALFALVRHHEDS
jgi:uncharacterized membrane protein YesL